MYKPNSVDRGRKHFKRQDFLFLDPGGGSIIPNPKPVVL